MRNAETLPAADTLRVLFVEDSDADVELCIRQLRKAGYHVTSDRVETLEDLTVALQSDWDLVLSDFNLPRFRGDQALEMVRASKGPDIPFIIVSGTIGEERAVALLKAGANDFIIKSSSARLIPAIDRELKDAQLRRERREAMEGMRQAIAARDEFLMIASHELKTPLTALMLQLESLSRLTRQEGETRPLSAARPKTEVLIRQGYRLQVLIESLLDISRVTSGELNIRISSVDLSKLVRDCVDHVVELAGAVRSELRLELPRSLPFRCDPERIELVVINLLTNAIKFGGGEPIDVRLEERGTGARITVRDHGIGIEPEDQARIFGRFERAVSSRHFGGFGVGLWLSQQIAKAHGGSIRAESETGKGSTFELELPGSS